MPKKHPISIASPEQLTAVLARMKSEKTHGVIGVKEFNSGVPGPRVILGTMTHGNERPTLATLLPLLNGGIHLKKGSILASVNNLAGVEENQRLVENFDFNRLPKDLFDPAREKEYLSLFPQSMQRMLDLKTAGVFDGTHCFDGHVVSHSPSPSMLIHIKGATECLDHIGIEKLIMDITGPQCNLAGDPAICWGDFVGGIENKEVPAVEVEGGGPGEEPYIMHRLVEGFLTFLASLEMIDPIEHGLTKKRIMRKIYTTTACHIAPAGYRVTDAKFCEAFGGLQKGELILEDPSAKQKPILILEDGFLPFPFPHQRTFEKARGWFTLSSTVLEKEIEAWVLED